MRWRQRLLTKFRKKERDKKAANMMSVHSGIMSEIEELVPLCSGYTRGAGVNVHVNHSPSGGYLGTSTKP